MSCNTKTSLERCYHWYR